MRGPKHVDKRGNVDQIEVVGAPYGCIKIRLRYRNVTGVRGDGVDELMVPSIVIGDLIDLLKQRIK